MELLRRTVLVGGALAGLWLFRIAPLDPVVTVAPVDFALQQKQEAESVPDERKTEAERRRALLPLSVYIEEFLQYNVHPASGPTWDEVLREADRSAAEQGRRGHVFVRPDEPPMADVANYLAAGGTTYVSISRPEGTAYYRVVAHRWSRDDFRPGAGFVGEPTPPASWLYPFRFVGLASILGGVALFVLLPAGGGASQRVSGFEAVALASGLLAFAAPLVATEGSAQALTRGILLTVPCWIVSAVGLHFFAAPWRNISGRPPTAIAGTSPNIAAQKAVPDSAFLREGLVFLLMALGPLVFLIWGTMTLWNR